MRRTQWLQASLMASVSSVAMLAWEAATPACAAPFRSINQALAAAPSGRNAVSPGSAASQQAAAGVHNLLTAMTRFRTMSQALQAAAAQAPAGPVPDGLVVGGLQPAAGYNAPGGTVWQGLSPTQPITETVSGGRTIVTINQAKPQAILNWQTFNVGAHTTVDFNQSAGNAGSGAATWSVLNRVTDPSGSPTRILGSIVAQGQVLVLNLNGVLFEAGSQVNLHSLVAGAVNIADTAYLATGIYSYYDNNGRFQPAFTAGPGSVTVEPGAVLATVAPTSVLNGGGSIILLGANATNSSGALIETPGGQTILGAGTSFFLEQGYSASQSGGGTISGNINSTVLGSEISTTGSGTATNAGMIMSTQGDITLDGQSVVQAGMLLSTTGVNQRGTIHLLNNLTNTVGPVSNQRTIANTAGSVVLEPGSVTEILPDTGSTTALNSALQAGTVPQVAYAGNFASPLLADQAETNDEPGLSRIEITAGGTVTFAAGSMALAPAGQIAVTAGQTILAQTGAVLNVSGLSNVSVPMSANQLVVNVEPYNFRDAPLNNSPSDPLNSNNIYLDTRDLTAVAASVADNSVRDYTPGGLLEVSGELADQGHTESEWSTVGGTIALYANTVVAQAGSTFNIAGGSESFAGGMLRQTYLIGPGGQLYNANIAPADLSYTGIYTGDKAVHARWHVTDSFINPLLTQADIYVPGYSIGRSAGELQLSAPTVIFAGTIEGGVTPGVTQTQAPTAGVADQFLEPQTAAPLAGTLALGDFNYQATYGFFPTSVVIDAAGSAASAASIGPGSSVPKTLDDTAVFSSAQLDGLGGVSLQVGDILKTVKTVPSITVETPLTLSDGAQVLFQAPTIKVQASITAPAGSIALETEAAVNGLPEGTITVASGVLLSTAGEFVNTMLDPATASLGAFTNGGTVTITSTRALDLAAGSSIDASAGALVGLQGSFAAGRGGSVTLTGDDPAGMASGKLAPITLDSAIAAYGGNTGGTLSLTAPEIIIGGSGGSAASPVVALAPAFFTAGFDDYIIDGAVAAGENLKTPGVSVASGTVLAPVAPILVASPAVDETPTQAPAGPGMPQGPGMQLYLPPEYVFNPRLSSVTQRTGVSLTLESAIENRAVSGTVTVNRGASITVDQGQSVTLSSPGQLTVDGTITAPAGTISLLNNTGDTGLIASAVATLSVWVGTGAVLDASAVAETSINANGQSFGVVPAGGSIIVGGPGSFANINDTNAPSAFVFIRPGALIEADGTQAGITQFTGGLTQNSSIAGAGAGSLIQAGSAGGTLTFVSADGIYLDGAMQAFGGTANAAGGTLRIQLDTPQFEAVDGNGASVANPLWTLTPHRILVTGTTTPTLSAALLQPGSLSPGQSKFLLTPAAEGQAAISQEQITDGGFDTVALFARDQIAFAGDVTLHARLSISLTDYVTSETSLTGTATINAPYVLFQGAPVPVGYDDFSYGESVLLGSYATQPVPAKHVLAPCIGGGRTCTGAVLDVNASLIDFEGVAQFVGADRILTDADTPQGTSVSRTLTAPGFNLINLFSSGDIRFAANDTQYGYSGSSSGLIGLPLQETALIAYGDLNLAAGRIYPDTGVAASIIAGYSPKGTGFYAAGTIDITGNGGTAEPAPLSAFGTLSLSSYTINQGGVLEAPLGRIQFGNTNVQGIESTRYAESVNLLPGSVTSVSAAGLDIPFGGTVDGVNYSYAGTALTFQPASYGAAVSGDPNQSIVFDAHSVTAKAGAVLDLDGGGTLSGGGGELLNAAGTGLISQGFISGSGGSTDVLVSSIITFNLASHSYAQSVASSNPQTGTGIYAILPGANLAYAPNTFLDAASDYAGSVAVPGQTVTIAAGVPGLPAGTYALLPSYYALLPGAFRVQFTQGSTTADPVAAHSFDGISTVISGTLGFANSQGVRNSLPTALVVTPTADVTRYAQYDQQSYSAFAVAAASVLNTPRPYLPQDAGALIFQFSPSQGDSAIKGEDLALQFDGTAALSPANGGYNGLVAIETTYGGGLSLDILAANQQPVARAISVPADTIDALKAPLLEIGGDWGSQLQSGGYIQSANALAGTVTVQAGATLTAGAVWLFAANQITVDPGAEISTLGATPTLPDSSTGAVFLPGSGSNFGALFTAVATPVLGVANGDYTVVSPSAAGGTGNVTIGAPNGSDGADPVKLLSDGFVGVFAGGNILLSQNTGIGTANFELAEPEINVVGTVGTSSAGTIPAGVGTAAGFTITQATFADLIAGSASASPQAPALQTFELSAEQSLNFFGTVDLNAAGQNGKPGLQSFILNTPSIYGYGSATDVASLEVPNLVWEGGETGAGAVVANGPGTGLGTLRISAQQITIGYPAQAQTQTAVTLTNLILGFATVDLTATSVFDANNAAQLSIYQARGAWVGPSGYAYSGGALSLATPLLTTAPGAVLGVTAGGGVTLASLPAGPGSVAAPDGLGGEITIAGASIADATAVALPGGRLSLEASGDIVLAAGASVDLSGRSVAFFDVTQSSWGGTLAIASADGNVTAAAGSSIDISAANNNAGAIDISAAGTASLLGSIAGSGGAGFGSGSITVTAGSIGAFASLNTTLDTGDVFGTRHFEQTGPGDLVVGSGVVAQDIAITLDQGSLTVDGTLAANGDAPGTISLAASSGLTLTASAFLDAHGTVLQTDHTGATEPDGTGAIASENTAQINITVSTGTLVIDQGAAFDLTSPDGMARGDMEINVPRTAPGSGDANIAAGGPPLSISGAATIAVNAFETYLPSSSLLGSGLITQAALDTINADSTNFINAAVQDGALTGPLAARLAGLATGANAGAFHLRPGVEIESDANSGGNLTVNGDLDLSGYRFASVNASSQQVGSVYGSGEPGVLWLRASGNLDVYGSVSDGFAPPPRTPDDDGWVLKSGKTPGGESIVLPQTVTLGGLNAVTGGRGANGNTTYPVGDYTLTYAVTIHNGATLNPNAVIPASVALDTATIVPGDFVLNGTIVLPSGSVLHAGQTIKVGTSLPAGTVLKPGTILPFSVAIGGGPGTVGFTVPAGTNYSIFSTQNGNRGLQIVGTLKLRAGDIIPAGASIHFAEVGVTKVNLRPFETVDGNQIQGQVWAVAPMLPAGDLSWSLRMVAGADLASSDSRSVLPEAILKAGATAANPAPGSIVLSDPHLGVQSNSIDFSVLRTGTGSLDLIAGGDLTEASLFGVYTAGTQSPGVAGTGFDTPRPMYGNSILGIAGNFPGLNGATYNAADSVYQAYYPTDGGNLLVSAGGNLVGDTIDDSGFHTKFYYLDGYATDTVATWLWWQGSATQPTAWWINFGTYVTQLPKALQTVYLVGFTGFGTLGGGNATIIAGGDAGVLPGTLHGIGSGALDVAVASTGRVDAAAGQVDVTGGGILNIAVAGTINPDTEASFQTSLDAYGGAITDLRGTIGINAGAIGTIVQTYIPFQNFFDPRPDTPFISETFQSAGGPQLVLGDTSATLDAMGSLVLGGVGDPLVNPATQYGGQIQLANQVVDNYGTPKAGTIFTSFSLWQPTTSLGISALGGSVVPVTSGGAGSPNDTGLYPPTFSATSFGGNIDSENNSIELAPSPAGELQLLAAVSIYDVQNIAVNSPSQGSVFSMSGAPAGPGDIPTPLNPAFGSSPDYFTFDGSLPIGLLHVGDPQPARFYAVAGDIVGLAVGSASQNSPTAIAKATEVRAGEDIVNLKLAALNNNAYDISTIQAGRNIIYTTGYVEGPGLLEVEAGNNVYEGDEGSFVSFGEIGKALTQGTRDDGAGILVLSGVQAAGPDLADFANLYFNAANLANPDIPLKDQPGRVVRTYAAQLLAWLQQRFGYRGSAADALDTFLALPQPQQTAFVLSVYFDELNQSGLDRNNPASPFYHSYDEGNEAIATLFPKTDFSGKSPPDGGSLTLFSGQQNGATLDASIRTLFGGGITTVVPFGQTSLGNYGFVPGPNSGVITEGGGDINMYSYGSVNLGQSKVLTTFGGNITIWMSSDGEINAGRGSKSSVLNAPVGISYDDVGNITLSPTVPVTGGGIGTISPIPQVPPGNVNLIAPVGTIDAGEAGIRASGNANLAALILLNANNVIATGKVTGVPTIVAPSAAAQAAASSTAGAAEAVSAFTSRPAAQQPSLIEVDVLSLGAGDDTDDKKRRRVHQADASGESIR